MTKKIFKRSVWTLLAVFLTLFFAIVMVADGISRDYESWIDNYFDVTRYKLVENDEQVSDDELQYYKSDYAKRDENGNLVLVENASNIKQQTYDSEAMRKHSMDVAERVGEEGSVLMWNENGALPLSEGNKVSLFGVSSNSWLFHGTGSGGVAIAEPYLKDALTSRKLELNNTLMQAMRLASIGYGRSYVQHKENDWRLNMFNYIVGEVPWDVLNSTSLGSVEPSVVGFGDAAIYPITRNGGEGSDTNMFAAPGTEDGKYLSFNEAEKSVLKGLCRLKSEKKLKKIILLLNSPTMLPIKDIAEFIGGENGIDACLWVGLGGSANLEYVADLLVGNANPSGRLPDTWAYDLMSAPANENMGNYTYTEHPDLGKLNGWSNKVDKYLVYQEGIYVGYRYYETRYEDAVLGRGNASSAAGAKMSEGGWSYGAEVAFPFGNGLSYTDFAYSDFKAERKKDGDYIVSVTVKNTGDRAGKEAVQIYLQKPYTEYDKANGVEKSAVELVGIAKTDLLAPGASETVKITVDDYELKSYDSYGKGTYILEKGDYYLAVGKDSHDAVNNILAAKGKTKADGMDAEGKASFAYKFTVNADDFEKHSVSPFTGNKIENRFNDADVNLYSGTKGQEIAYLSRKDWQGTYPSAVSLKVTDPDMAKDLDPNGTFEEDPNAKMPNYDTVSSEHGKLTVIQMKGLPYDDPLWEALLDQMTFKEQFDILRLGSYNFAGATSIAYPAGKAGDGPCGVRIDNPRDYGLSHSMAFPCNPIVAATFNLELVEEMGDAFGMEALNFGRGGVYGSGVNIHRSAYSGRNWEYYSEDGFLSGIMSSYLSKGLRNRGVIPFVKHFALNDEEANRQGVAVWANEQSIREIYLKAFETGITDGYSNGIMTSYNRIGCTWAGRHKELLTDVLRGEWGFMGFTLSDSPTGPHMFGTSALIASGLVAGQDMWLGSVGPKMLEDYENNATVCQALREATHRTIYTRLDSMAMNGISSSTKIVYVRPAWEKLLLAMEIVLGIFAGLALAGVAASWVFYFRNKRVNA